MKTMIGMRTILLLHVTVSAPDAAEHTKPEQQCRQFIQIEDLQSLKEFNVACSFLGLLNISNVRIR
jgi:hypothetical protein